MRLKPRRPGRTPQEAQRPPWLGFRGELGSGAAGDSRSESSCRAADSVVLPIPTLVHADLVWEQVQGRCYPTTLVWDQGGTGV